jgi:hypothetical protein
MNNDPHRHCGLDSSDNTVIAFRATTRNLTRNLLYCWVYFWGIAGMLNSIQYHNDVWSVGAWFETRPYSVVRAQQQGRDSRGANSRGAINRAPTMIFK